MQAGAVRVTPSGTAASSATTISVSTGSQLDLADGKLVTRSAPGTWTGTSYDGVTGLIAKGRNGGAWNGEGIITSMSAATSLVTTLAVATADEVSRVGSNFGGVTLASGDVMVMYTYAGDADLSGTITGDDYFRIDNGYASRSSQSALLGYFNGDFDYNGRIDADDYFLIDRNYSRQDSAFSAAAPASGVTAMPEPAGAVVAAGLLLTCCRRTRRRNFQI